MKPSEKHMERARGITKSIQWPHFVEDIEKAIAHALALTEAETRASVIEECAKVADSCHPSMKEADSWSCCQDVAKKIRRQGEK